MSSVPWPGSNGSQMCWQVLVGVADLAQAVAGILVRLTEHASLLSHADGETPAKVWKGVSLLPRELGEELEKFSARIHKDPSTATFEELEQLAQRMGRHVDGFWMSIHSDVDLLPYLRPELQTDLSFAFDELMDRIGRGGPGQVSRSASER